MGVSTTWFAAKPTALAARGSGARSDKEAPWDSLSLAVVIVATALVLATFRDYGVTWDEDAHNWYGNFVLGYYLSFFGDKTALHWRDLYNYGAVFDTMAAALNRISPIGVYETRHLLNGFVGVLGLIGCWKLARAVAGARAGFIAALLLILTPNYYGQMFNNPKDIPFAAGVVWATYYMVRIIPTLPRPPPLLVAKQGVVIGASMGVRIGGLLLVCCRPGHAYRISGHVDVLAMGADRPGRESAARAAIFLSPDLPFLHTVCRPVHPGNRPPLDLSSDLHRDRADRAGFGLTALCTDRVSRRVVAQSLCLPPRTGTRSVRRQHRNRLSRRLCDRD